MLKAAICDNDIFYTEKVHELICKYNQAATRNEGISLSKYNSPKVLLDNVLDNDRFDIFLLEVEMTEINGIEFAKQIREKLPEAVIIFLSNYTHFNYIQESFKVDALRYIWKEKMEDTLFEALDAAVKRAKQCEESQLVLAHYSDSIRVKYNDIVCIKRAKRTSEIIVLNNEPIKDTHTLIELYQMLNDTRFVYIDRSCFVNISHVTRTGEFFISLSNGDKLAISRRMLSSLRQSMARFWSNAE